MLKEPKPVGFGSLRVYFEHLVRGGDKSCRKEIIMRF